MDGAGRGALGGPEGGKGGSLKARVRSQAGKSRTDATKSWPGILIGFFFFFSGG